MKPNRNFLQTTFCCLALTCAGASVYAEVITTVTASGGGGLRRVFDSLGFVISYGVGPTNVGSVFGGRQYTAADAGTVFTADSEREPGFDGFVSHLTNGVNDSISRVVTGAGLVLSGSLSLESTFFKQLPAGGNGFDLQGFRIDSIDLLFSNLSFITPGRNLGGDGIWTDYSYSATVTFNGASLIPEPGVLPLLATGLLVYLGHRHRAARVRFFQAPVRSRGHD